MVARIGLPKLIALSGAVLMVVVGFALSQVIGDREAPAAPRRVSSAGPPPLSTGVAASPVLTTLASTPVVASDRRASEQVGRPESSAATAEIADAETRSASSSVARPASKSAASPKPAPKTRATRSLPPLPPPDWSMNDALAEPSGPPPGVLWVSGVIQGDPRVALLRRGDSRYVVKEGDIIEDRYVVAEIGNNSVTLKYGSRTRTLRVGKY